MPRNIVIDSTAMIIMVAAAFLASGGLNAGTPFETASTPVMAVHPFENALSSRKSVSGCPSDAIGSAGSTGCTVPVMRAPGADRDQREQADDEEVRRRGENIARTRGCRADCPASRMNTNASAMATR